jgi:hypothetical protein
MRHFLPHALQALAHKAVATERWPHPLHQVGEKPHRWGTLGACSRGQQRTTPVAHGPLGLMAHLGERRHLEPAKRHAVYGMQGVRGLIPSAPPGTTHRQDSRSGLFVSRLSADHSCDVANTLSTPQKFKAGAAGGRLRRPSSAGDDTPSGHGARS